MIPYTKTAMPVKGQPGKDAMRQRTPVADRPVIGCRGAGGKCLLTSTFVLVPATPV